MGKYLDIADKALREQRKQPESRITPSARYYERNEVNELSHLRLLAGDDWPEIENDPAQLRALRAAAETADMIQRGEIPPHYTHTTTCRHCGEVPIFPGVPDKVEGCPWCFRRAT